MPDGKYSLFEIMLDITFLTIFFILRIIYLYVKIERKGGATDEII